MIGGKSITQRWRRAPGEVNWTFAWRSDPPRWVPLMFSLSVVSLLALVLSWLLKLELPPMRQAALPAAEVISVGSLPGSDSLMRRLAETGPQPLRLTDQQIRAAAKARGPRFLPESDDHAVLGYRYQPGFVPLSVEESPLASEPLMVFPALPAMPRRAQASALLLQPRVELLEANGWRKPLELPRFDPVGGAKAENRKYLLHLSTRGRVLQCVGLAAEGKRRDVLLESWLLQLCFVAVEAKAGWVAVQVRWEGAAP